MGPSCPTRDGLTPPPHPHRRGADLCHIESDRIPRLEKDLRVCVSHVLNLSGHVVVFFFVNCFRRFAYICIYTIKFDIYTYMFTPF